MPQVGGNSIYHDSHRYIDSMIQITTSIAIAESELTFEFIRASGPGGQNINKVATAVQLRFDLRGSNSLPVDVKVRLGQIAGKRMSSDGVLVIEAKRHRTQSQNRNDAINRLVKLVKQAAIPPKPRIKTRPTLASKERRLEAKRQRAGVKRSRGRPEED